MGLQIYSNMDSPASHQAQCRLLPGCSLPFPAHPSLAEPPLHGEERLVSPSCWPLFADLRRHTQRLAVDSASGHA